MSSLTDMPVLPRADNLRKLARETREAGNSERAADYYEQLAVLCPDDWEASFFSVYFTSASCKIGQIASAASHSDGKEIISPTLPGFLRLVPRRDL